MSAAPNRHSAPSVEDKLEVMVHRMTDEELRATKEKILGHPKRHLNMGESLALLAVMAEEARRARV